MVLAAYNVVAITGSSKLHPEAIAESGSRPKPYGDSLRGIWRFVSFCSSGCSFQDNSRLAQFVMLMCTVTPPDPCLHGRHDQAASLELKPKFNFL